MSKSDVVDGVRDAVVGVLHQRLRVTVGEEHQRWRVSIPCSMFISPHFFSPSSEYKTFTSVEPENRCPRDVVPSILIVIGPMSSDA